MCRRHSRLFDPAVRRLQAYRANKHNSSRDVHITARDFWCVRHRAFSVRPDPSPVFARVPVRHAIEVAGHARVPASKAADVAGADRAIANGAANANMFTHASMVGLTAVYPNTI
jgi:hypothetical protein